MRNDWRHTGGHPSHNINRLLDTVRNERVLDCNNMRTVIPAVFKRESIDYPRYPLSRV